MSLLQKLPDNLNKTIIFQRIAAAHKVPYSWRNNTANTKNLVKAYADSLGCPDEYIFFPLLTVAASFIGNNGTVKINDSWEEPSIAWFNVCARKGQKKTAALNVLAKPVAEIQRELQENFKEDNEDFQEKELPRLMVDHFSFEKLHQVMSSNNNKILGAYDELTQFYNMLDHYKTNSSMDRKTLLALNGGGQWTRDFKNGSATMEKTCLNITGFIQPAYVVKMLSQDDYDGFNDRQLYVCPEERDVDYEALVPFDSTTIPQLKSVYQLIQENHALSTTYTFDNDAHTVFKEFHDELKTRKIAIQHDENRRGIIAKAIGQMARVCMIVHVLDFAVDAAFQEINDLPSNKISCSIGRTSALQAKTIINHIIDTKFAMMPPEEKLPQNNCQAPETTNDESEQPQNYVFDAATITEQHSKYVKKILLFKGVSLKPSDVSGRHLMPPVKPAFNTTNRYPTTAAESFLKTLGSLGFGDIVPRSANSKSRKTIVFKKRRVDAMDEEAQTKFKKLDIPEENYNNTFT